MRTMLIAAVTSVIVCLAALLLFWRSFATAPEHALETCHRHHWELEGTGPYQHKHCVDPLTRQMYLPPEFDP